MKRTSNFLQGACLAALVGLLPAGAWAQVYVDATVVGGAGDGSSWENAYVSLLDAANVASSDTEIWVAKGAYTPGTVGADRSSAFTISANRVSLYGGFTSGMTTRDQRDWVKNRTILSGDFAGDDTANWGGRAENAYSVIRVRSDSITPVNIVIDGFLIRGGNADADDNSTFLNSNGGAVYVYNSTGLRLANCVIADNSASGGGGVYLRRSRDAVLENCILSGNRAAFQSGAHNFGSGALGIGAQTGPYGVTARHCRFTGNSSVEYGGVFYSTHVAFTNSFWNCLFVGNLSSEAGGGVYLRNFPGTLINCTFSRNMPSAVAAQGAQSVATNAILWNDFAEVVNQGGGGALLSAYSDILGTGGGGTGNLDVDPLFVRATNGNWTADAVYSPATGLTQLSDASANWPNGRLAGGTVNPDQGQNLHYFIATNSATALYVWGDATVGANGDLYNLHDWHLTTNSPCADTGDPSFDSSNEPDYPNGLIDMGAYGNTKEAATTNPPPVEVFDLPSGFKLIVR